MRLWSLHPKYLDAKGLTALWREGLLARQVLRGLTKGYRAHPQLIRFRESESPLEYLEMYLHHVFLEAEHRGYCFDATKVSPPRRLLKPLPVTTGQVQYELTHLRSKLAIRAPEQYRQLAEVSSPDPHPILYAVPGDIADWEKH